MKCLTCQVETQNPKFCSQSCAAIYTNKAFPKRKLIKRFCKKCGVELPIVRSKSTGKRLIKTVCDSCNKNKVDWNNVMKQDITSKRKYQPNSRIRNLSRDAYRGEKKCFICGYNTHIEVCHKKPISSFPGNTPISIINAQDNLVALCPNHHWELDNNIISL